MVHTKRWVPYAYVAPLVALLALIFGYAVVRVVDFSTRHVHGGGGTFVGLDNFRAALEDPTFRAAARNSAMLLVAVPILLLLSLALSVLLYERVRGWRVYRSILFLPYILAVPVIGIVFGYILQLRGSFNGLLGTVGLDGLAQDWLGSEHWALWAVIGVIVWREVGFGIVLFLARLLSLDEHLLEAARLDGANWWQRLWHVIVPQLRSTIEFYAVIATITVLASVFGYVYVMTSGGPGGSTNVLELFIYHRGIVGGLQGIASAVAVMLLLVTALLVAVVFRLRRASADEEGV